MAATRRRRSAPADDPLREKLDQLAELAVDRVLAKGNDATLREITETLKTVSAYRDSTVGVDAPPPAKSAWDRYRGVMSNGSEDKADGARH